AIITKPFDINEIVNILEDCARERYGADITNVLVIETEDIVSDFFRKLLKGYAVTIAKTGEQALEILAKQEFDLVVSDMILKDMSGVDLYARIRDLQPEAKVILVTGDAAKTDDLVKNHLYHQIRSLLQ
ncbi:MAG: response regulator, partial [Candidatus Omnitrophica bacterium]|nr:response regulator [Candidatus Omnitrophota bacterium]